MTNLTIANIFLFCAILCLALSAMIGSPFYFIYSFDTTALAGHSAPQPAPSETLTRRIEIGCGECSPRPATVARMTALPTRGDRMPTRTARTAWTGTLEQGSGQVELTSSPIATYDVSFPKRAAERAGGTTSPEELIAAAHSACYAMQLSARAVQAGGTPAPSTSRPRSGSAPTGRWLPADRHRAHRPR